MKFLSIALFLLGGLCSTAFADESPGRWTVYGSLGQVAFDSKQAKQEGIEDSAFYLRMPGEYQQSSLLAGFGIAGMFYKDSKDFQQTVKDQFGNVSTADSSANAFNLFGEAGYRFLLSDEIHFDVMGGYEQVVSSSRSISNCSNCYEEKIHIKSGAYVAPRLQYETTGGWTFSLSYQQNLSGDVNHAVYLSIGKY